MKAPRYIADFDSSTGMLRATARFLHGKGFPMLGLSPAPVLKLYAAAVNLLPERPREFVYSISGAKEGISARDLDRVNAEELSRWTISEYPRRTYPAVMIGSSNGAAVHLCAALGIPWLPQTVLIPVRRTGVAPDDMKADMEWGRTHAGSLLDRNPELQLHHMHDPNQDHLMIRYMTYFRVKRLRLGAAFERFITDSVEPGGTLFLLECEQRWPTARVGERHFFQPGAVGGLEPEEYLRGSERVADFLSRYGFDRRAWDPPRPDAERPEAEWGFEPALREDVERFARKNGYRVQRIIFPEPESLSPLVADLYRWWYEQRGIPANRLLIESFVVMEPWWALRTGSVPFWTKFGVESSADALERYLVASEPFEEIYGMLFSHGTESAGLAPIERWRALVRRARKQGGFIGVDEEKYPKDFAVFARYHTELQKVSARYPIPEPLSLGRLDAFLEQAEDRYPVRWSGHP
jgi:hypothetical protein